MFSSLVLSSRDSVFEIVTELGFQLFVLAPRSAKNRISGLDFRTF